MVLKYESDIFYLRNKLLKNVSLLTKCIMFFYNGKMTMVYANILLLLYFKMKYINKKLYNYHLSFKYVWIKTRYQMKMKKTLNLN